MTLLGTEDVDWRLLDAAFALPDRSRGDREVPGDTDRADDSEPDRLRDEASAPRWGERVPGVFGLEIPVSVCALCLPRGRPIATG